MYLLFDIGGTNTRVARSDDLASFGTPRKFDTPKSFEDGIEAFCYAAEALSNGEKVEGVAGGIRGPQNRERTTIVSETVLCDWVGKPIKRTLEDRLGAPVQLQNDAGMAALGEANFGAGKGYSIVAYHTVSTGVGGARVVDGRLDEARSNFEPGHQIVDIANEGTGKRGPQLLEDIISGAALEEKRGVKPYEVPQSDPVWDELARYLAYGLKNTVAYWSPDVIVLGGSMVLGDPRILLADVVRHTKEALQGLEECPPIVDAAFRDDGGLYGAMALLRQKLGKDARK
jgi:predicted NBD/HSP70 family sugar kinase